MPAARLRQHQELCDPERDILDAAKAAGGKDIIVVGYDVGGMIAFACARDHGARIDGAVVMNTVISGLDPWAHGLADPRVFHFALHNIPELTIAPVQA